MSFSRQSLEIMLDLIEIKMGALQVQDRDDARELNRLKKCRQELLTALSQIQAKRAHRFINPLSQEKQGLEEPDPLLKD